jgi:hypothetical protein
VQYSVSDIEKNNKRHLSGHFFRVLSSSTSSVVRHFYNIRKSKSKGIGNGVGKGVDKGMGKGVDKDSHSCTDRSERKSAVLMEKVRKITLYVSLLIVVYCFNTDNDKRFPFSIPFFRSSLNQSFSFLPAIDISTSFIYHF